MIKIKFFINLIVIIFVAVVCLTVLGVKPLDDKDIKHVKIGGVTLNVELALTEEAQAQGLSGRTELKENEGLLFVFASPDIYGFWMKDMNFPIDIIWLDENSKIIYIKRDAEPSSFPEAFKPEENSKYVLEVVAGFSDEHNLEVGDDVKFLQ